MLSRDDIFKQEDVKIEKVNVPKIWSLVTCLKES